MLVVIWAFNNITTHKLFHAYYGVLSDNYYYWTTNDFKKLLDKKSTENPSMITFSIFLVLCIQIGLTKLLEDSILNVNFDVDGRLRPKFTSLN